MRKFLMSLLLLTILAACSGKDGKGADHPAPLVKAEPARIMPFVDRIEAIGTARANEQVTLSAPVTERIIRLGFDDGAFVNRGQVIAVLAQGQEAAQLSEAEARSREAEQQLARIRTLRVRGFATKSSLDAQAALAAQANAQAAGAKASIGDRVVKAPFSGWVSLRTISTGAVINAGSAIVMISDLSSIKLDFAVPETILAAIRPGLVIEARSAAYPDQPFSGRIATIDPVIDPATRAAMVRARLPNPGHRLKPGMLLTVTIEAAPRLSLSVPELAVVGEGESRFVYIVDKDRVRRTSVRTGVRSDGRVEILQGLRQGQSVVTEGVVKLSDGLKVKLADAQSEQNMVKGSRS